MKILEIVDWDENFESDLTREMETLAWVPIPNKMDGDGYTELMDHEHGMIVFGAWILLVEITSKCKPRGLLVRSGLKLHDAASLARITHRKSSEFDLAIPVLISIGWLRYKEMTEEELRVTGTLYIEKKGKERKGRYGLDPSILEKQKNLTRARNLAYHEIMEHLNEKTKRRFLITNKATQRHINARLAEGYTIEDFKAVIDKKTVQWLNDPRMSPYLRPQTLFAGKFESYLNEPEIGPGGSTTVSERTGHLFEGREE